MTTDITELAQREKFEAWAEECNALPWGYLKKLRIYTGFYSDHTYTSLWAAWKAAGAELVEALEKAQQVDEELCRLLPPGAEYMDPPDGGDVTPLEGVRRMVADYRQRIAELESRTVKLPPELYTIGELIRTQDNRITDQPMFVVFQKREIIGSDEHSPSRICWVWDGEEVSELRAKRLEALYQDGRDTRGYDRYAMRKSMSLLLPALPSMDAKTICARTAITCGCRTFTPAALSEITNISWLEIGSLASRWRLSDVERNRSHQKPDDTDRVSLRP
ncbi:hypothetical protein M4B20_19910 [Klebsiella pneumoniae]|nr:hypothetical protein [Klebsiella pneumoniae]